MNRTEKAPGSVRALSEAAGGMSGETDSSFDFTSGCAGRQGRIFSLLLAGEQNAIPASDLTTLSGYKNQRSMRLGTLKK